MIVVYQLLREYCPCFYIQGSSFVVIATRLSTSTKCAIVINFCTSDIRINNTTGCVAWLGMWAFPPLAAITVHQMIMYVRWPATTSVIQAFSDWAALKKPGARGSNLLIIHKMEELDELSYFHVKTN